MSRISSASAPVVKASLRLRPSHARPDSLNLSVAALGRRIFGPGGDCSRSRSIDALPLCRQDPIFKTFLVSDSAEPTRALQARPHGRGNLREDRLGFVICSKRGGADRRTRSTHAPGGESPRPSAYREPIFDEPTKGRAGKRRFPRFRLFGIVTQWPTNPKISFWRCFAASAPKSRTSRARWRQNRNSVSSGP